MAQCQQPFLFIHLFLNLLFIYSMQKITQRETMHCSKTQTSVGYKPVWYSLTTLEIHLHSKQETVRSITQCSEVVLASCEQLPRGSDLKQEWGKSQSHTPGALLHPRHRELWSQRQSPVRTPRTSTAEARSQPLCLRLPDSLLLALDELIGVNVI